MIGQVAAVICAIGSNAKCNAVNMKITPKAEMTHEQCVLAGRTELAKFIAANKPGYELLFIGCTLVETRDA